jgi:hypothetical protein
MKQVHDVNVSRLLAGVPFLWRWAPITWRRAGARA